MYGVEKEVLRRAHEDLLYLWNSIVVPASKGSGYTLSQVEQDQLKEIEKMAGDIVAYAKNTP